MTLSEAFIFPTCFGLETPKLLVVCAAIALAGLVRGFAGFGAAMIYMPLASSVMDPKFAAATLLLIDGVSSAPLAAVSCRICDWKTVFPAALGSLTTVFTGTWVLVHSNPYILRWGLSATITLLLAVLISGWQYTKAPKPHISFTVGTISGLLGGMTQLAGPPVITYWMSGPAPAQTIRANLITFFFLTGLGSFCAFIWNGLITEQLVYVALVLAPPYSLCILVGAKSFPRITTRSYRKFAYTLIFLSAFTSLPALDTILR